MANTDIGRYGTLHLVKRGDPTQNVASYPIDADIVTIGRDPGCSIRLYYAAVSAVHAKVTFTDMKAFLLVLGGNGLLVDGCLVFPSPTSSTTVPLSNNSTIEIHKKTFRFTYPPREMRSILQETPVAKRRKSLRMSMINTAEILTPAQKNDPKAILHVLQSPIKGPSSPLKKSHVANEEEDEEEPVILVEGDKPRVLEADDDLVVMEDIEQRATSPLRRVPASPRSQKTPLRSKPSQTLHRSALIRSMTQEKGSEEQLPISRDGDTEMEVSLSEDSTRNSEKSSWRKSIASVTSMIFRAGSAPPEIKDEEVSQTAAEISLVDDNHFPEVSTNITTPPKQSSRESLPAPKTPTGPARTVRPLGKFMTPQISQASRTAAPRHSISGPFVVEESSKFGGARRIKIERPWKVEEIPASLLDLQGSVTTLGSPRKSLSDEERRSILERRKSALDDNEPQNFFGGQTPGMRSPATGNHMDVPPPTPSIGVLDQDEEKERREQETRTMLQKMAHNNESWKRRQSERLSLSPHKGPLISQASAERHPHTGITLPPPKLSITKAPATPSFAGLREMFNKPKVVPQTPNFEGLREMYRSEKSPEPLLGSDDEDEEDALDILQRNETSLASANNSKVATPLRRLATIALPSPGKGPIPNRTSNPFISTSLPSNPELSLPTTSRTVDHAQLQAMSRTNTPSPKKVTSAKRPSVPDDDLITPPAKKSKVTTDDGKESANTTIEQTEGTKARARRAPGASSTLPASKVVPTSEPLKKRTRGTASAEPSKKGSHSSGTRSAPATSLRQTRKVSTQDKGPAVKSRLPSASRAKPMAPASVEDDIDDIDAFATDSKNANGKRGPTDDALEKENAPGKARVTKTRSATTKTVATPASASESSEPSKRATRSTRSRK